MNMKIFQEAVARTWNSNNSLPMQLSNACMGLAGEAGELIDIIKKHVYHGHTLAEDKIRKEIGDVFYYAACLCNLFGWNAAAILEENVEKLRKRYPDGFSEKASIERADQK